jgi:cytosine/adenosine deaminase-related metal-dependent hydrolase
MAKQTGYPFLRTFISHDVRLAIGTDWGAFDVLAEVRLLAQLPSFIPGIPEFSAVELLRMATINGAETLGIGTETGSIEPGKRADCVLLKLEDIRVPAVSSHLSAENLAALLIRSPQPPAVSDVLLHGVVAVHNGQLVHQDERALLAEFHRLRQRWGIDAAPSASSSGAEEAQTSAPGRSRIFQLIPREPEGPTEISLGPPRASAVQPQERTANLSAPKRRISPKRPPIHPELPKDVRRVFGEDDEA